ncbi:MAG: SDR family oxidoreductase [Planctomycetaceae bacterium]|nr:SDR family oxidoreductase [Planctomycetaceae bacterium]
MRVLIIGGAGMIGGRLIRQLEADTTLNGEPVDHVISFDVIETPATERLSLSSVTGDLSDPQQCQSLIAHRPDVIFHLAAIVSGEAEADFEKGYRINLDGTRHLLDAIVAAADYCPRVVFTSSIAVFGAPFPGAISDEFHTAPLTSYGTQKAIAELLLNDFSRRQLLDGVGIRLPTICVRPGKPNKAASGFFSNIIREPLAGEEAVLPVSEDVRHWHASPQSAVNFLTHAAGLKTDALGTRRNLTMPGLSVTVGEQIDALRRVAGDNVVARIRRVPDDAIAKMVAGWPRRFAPERALQLGFRGDDSFESIIRQHIECELGGVIR